MSFGTNVNVGILPKLKANKFIKMSEDDLRDPFLDPATDDDIDVPKDEVLDIEEEEDDSLWEDEE